jgi:hypothetical protein
MGDYYFKGEEAKGGVVNRRGRRVVDCAFLESRERLGKSTRGRIYSIKGVLRGGTSSVLFFVALSIFNTFNKLFPINSQCLIFILSSTS